MAAVEAVVAMAVVAVVAAEVVTVAKAATRVAVATWNTTTVVAKRMKSKFIKVKIFIFSEYFMNVKNYHFFEKFYTTCKIAGGQ